MHMQSHDVCFTQTEIVSYFSEWCGTLATGLNNQHIVFYYPPRSRPGMSKCAKSQPEPLAIDEAPSSAGLGWKAP